jgi:hypothetical protein
MTPRCLPIVEDSLINHWSVTLGKSLSLSVFCLPCEWNKGVRPARVLSFSPQVQRCCDTKATVPPSWFHSLDRHLAAQSRA